MNVIHLYQHPDGFCIDFEKDSGYLLVDEYAKPTVVIPIGPLGLIELAKKMMQVGEEVTA